MPARRENALTRLKTQREAVLALIAPKMVD
jgi:hypothetical protein